MTKIKSASHTCFDRIVPTSNDPERAREHQAALSRYAAAIRKKATSDSTVPRDASFTQHVAAIGKLARLSTNDPVHVARMAVINLKKWDDRNTLRCRFLHGDDTQKGKVEKKAKMWEQYANLKLDFGDDANAEIRISFQADPGS